MTSDQTILSRPDRNTILAALRYYQERGLGDPTQRPAEIHAIATDGDEDSSLDVAGIDDLCDRLNRAGAAGDLVLRAPSAGIAAIAPWVLCIDTDTGLLLSAHASKGAATADLAIHCRSLWPTTHLAGDPACLSDQQVVDAYFATEGVDDRAAIEQCTVSRSADPVPCVWILSDEHDDKREITLHATWPAAERAVAKVLENAMPEKPKNRAVFLAQLAAAGSDARTILEIGGVSSADRIIVELAPVEP